LPGACATLSTYKQVIGNGVAKGQGFTYPAFAQFQVISFDKLHVNQHLALLPTFRAVKIEKCNQPPRTEMAFQHHTLFEQ